MRQPLGLAARMARMRNGAAHTPRPDRRRPDGPLVWAHATSGDHANALVQLADRLAALHPRMHMLLSTPDDLPAPGHAHPAVIHQTLPEDSTAGAEAFLDHWAPDLCLWTGGSLRPAMITCTARRGIAMFLVDAQEARLRRANWRLGPDMPRALLRQFSVILTRDAATARQLQRLRLKTAQIDVSGVFQEGAIALPHDERLREEMAAQLRGRPVWLAAMVQPGELDTVLRAHRSVSRLAHRLFLILVPDDETRADLYRAELERGGWRYCVWSEGEEPHETTQILLADTRGEMGLWYRLATIAFMGSSLVSGATGRDPNEPAAHGAAILYGPDVSRYLASYARYAEAGAARIVRDADSLAGALQRLITPEQSAAMAHAAWDVASAGAAVTDRIVDLVQDRLDRIEAR